MPRFTQSTKKGVGVAAIWNLYEAKTSLSRLLERAAAGEAIVIAKAGRQVVSGAAMTRASAAQQALASGRGVA